MKKYFYSDGTNSFGPFSFEELKGKTISRETKVWFQDIQEWKPAGEIIELRELFSVIPPPLPKEDIFYSYLLIKNNNNGQVEQVTPIRWDEILRYYGSENFTIIAYLDESRKKIQTSLDASLFIKPLPPKSYLTESILVTIFCCLPFGVIGIVNAANVESRYNQGDIEGAKNASAQASKWVNLGIGSCIALVIIYLAFILFSTLIMA